MKPTVVNTHYDDFDVYTREKCAYRGGAQMATLRRDVNQARRHTAGKKAKR